MKPTPTTSLILAAALAAAFSPGAAAQTDGQTDEAGTELRQQTVVVTSRAQELYRVEETVTGKLPTEPLLSTQSITVLNAQLIADQGARNAQDLYRNISGVSVFSREAASSRSRSTSQALRRGSASASTAFTPAALAASVRFTATVVFPAPPLRDITASVFTWNAPHRPRTSVGALQRRR